jgi:hypothetical protein
VTNAFVNKIPEEKSERKNLVAEYGSKWKDNIKTK